MSRALARDFTNAGRARRIAIGDHVDYAGARGHVVELGRIYIVVLFYTVPVGHKGARHRIGPFSPGVTFPGSCHE